MRSYILSVICAALISGILKSMVQGNAVVKLLCSVFLAVTVLSPLSSLNWEEFFAMSLPDGFQIDQMTAAGENMAEEAMAGIIKERCESYILDKATGLHANLRVEISLSGENIPMAAALSGRASPDSKRKIERMLQTDMGIPKESVRWTG